MVIRHRIRILGELGGVPPARARTGLVGAGVASAPFTAAHTHLGILMRRCLFASSFTVHFHVQKTPKKKSMATSTRTMAPREIRMSMGKRLFTLYRSLRFSHARGIFTIRLAWPNNQSQMQHLCRFADPLGELRYYRR